MSRWKRLQSKFELGHFFLLSYPYKVISVVKLNLKGAIVRRWHILIENKLGVVSICFGMTTCYLIWQGQAVFFGLSGESLLRLWAALLQVSAVCVVLWDIVTTGNSFDIYLSSVARNNWQWVKQLITGRSHVSVCALAATTANVTAAMLTRSRKPIDRNAAILQRLEILESNQALIDAELDGVHKRIDKSNNDLRLQIDQEVVKIKEAHKATEDKLRVAVVGNYSPLLFGTVWLLVGIVISSLTHEIATRSFS